MIIDLPFLEDIYYSKSTLGCQNEKIKSLTRLHESIL